MANEGSTKPTYSEVVNRLRANIFNQEACEKILLEWQDAELATASELMTKSGFTLLAVTEKYKSANSELARVRGLLQRQWISVEERLPVVGDMVLLYVGGSDFIETGWRCFDGQTHIFQLERTAPQDEPITYEVAEGRVTHWMPLPELPTFRESSDLVPQGAESADIGKLDTADKSGLREPAKLNNAHKSGAESPLSSPPHNSDCICIPCMSKATGELLKRDVNLDPGRCCNNGYFGQQHKCQKSNPAASPELLPTQPEPKEKL